MSDIQTSIYTPNHVFSGLDASIGFEADREENLGIVFGDESFINRTIIGVCNIFFIVKSKADSKKFNLFAEVFISTSDFIALVCSS